MDNDTPSRPAPAPRWRRGWPWTLIKCALLTAITAAVGVVGMYYLVHSIEPPWYIPGPVYEWFMAHLAPYALWLGGIAGAFVGFLGSVGVVVYDAKRGRLSRVA